jgi:phosphoglycerol transferase MdoB-like AlkP superfamily enzyme
VQPPYDTLLPPGKLPILKSVRYTDAALQAFFRTASGMNWFRNTLFVITSDHTALADDYYYKTRAGIYAIPLAFFDPEDSTTVSYGLTVQQADILPSVMDYLGYPAPFFAFGSSIFDTTARHCAVNFLHGTYQLLQDDHSFIFDTLNGSQLYDLRIDPLQFHDIISTDPRRAVSMELQLKALLQQYNSSLLENRMQAGSPLSSSR